LTADGINDVLRIISIEIELSLREIYDRVEFNSFDFFADEDEDIYTLEDGKPIE